MFCLCGEYRKLPFLSQGNIYFRIDRQRIASCSKVGQPKDRIFALTVTIHEIAARPRQYGSSDRTPRGFPKGAIHFNREQNFMPPGSKSFPLSETRLLPVREEKLPLRWMGWSASRSESVAITGNDCCEAFIGRYLLLIFHLDVFR